MSLEAEIISHAIQVLKPLSREKPWMTARGLGRRIARDHQAEFSEIDIRTALIAHAKSDARVIRYGFYPSKKTLDILWGHIDVVGEHRSLPKPDRQDAPPADYSEGSVSADEGEEIGDDEPDAIGQVPTKRIFLSHNNRDADTVFALRDVLSSADRHECWMFQTEIAQHENIMLSVRDAISTSDCFISFVSRNSLGSLWVRKEFETVGYLSQLRPYVFVDGADEQLLNLFERWPDGWSEEGDHIRTYAGIFGQGIEPARRAAWENRCEDFLRSLHELLSEYVIYAFPATDRANHWSNEKYTLASVDEFLETQR